MTDDMFSSEMVDTFQEITTDLMEIHFLLKRISVSPYDKPWMSEELRNLRRRRQRVYRKQGRSTKYLKIKEEFDVKLKAAACKYKDKLIAEVTEGKRGSSYPAIRKLGNRDFEVLSNAASFEIPEFVDNNMNDSQSAEALADFFSAISQEFDPVNIDRLPPKIREELEKGKTDSCIPILHEHEVHRKMIKAKKPHSTVPGDIKRVLVKECDVELAEPVTKIYNKITK